MYPQCDSQSSPVEQNNKNIDVNEMKKFSSLASRWWNDSGEFQLLHRINSLRLDYILIRSGGLFGKKVLDVGCGGGILSESMALEGAKVTGLDIDNDSLVVARRHALESMLTLDYVHQTVEEHLQRHPYTYDVVTCMEMLEHVPDPASIARACAKLVKPGGDVFFSTLNRNIKSWMLAIIGVEYLLRMIPLGTHHLNKFIKPSELLSWIDNTLLHAKHIVGLHYNPIKNSFKLGNNIDVHYTLHMQNMK